MTFANSLRLNAQDMSLVSRPHERAHGVSKLGAQLRGQKRSKCRLGHRLRALLLGEGLIRHTLLLKGCHHPWDSITASHHLFVVTLACEIHASRQALSYAS